MVSKSFFKNHTKQEVVDYLNNLPLKDKIKVCGSFGWIEDVFNDHHLINVFDDIYAKRYLRNQIKGSNGYIVSVEFYYKKDDEEKSQDEYIYNLIK